MLKKSFTKFNFDLCLFLCLQARPSAGNLLKIENIDRVEVGMTKSQVRYLLGGPVIGNPYQTDRWDYIYLYQEKE